MRLARAALLAVALAGCAVFDESMRRPKADAGAPSASGTASIARPTDVCAIDAPPGDPIERPGRPACGGAGGGRLNGATETEPNDVSAETLRLDSPVCGEAKASDIDRFEFAVSTGDCVDVFVDVSGGTVTVEAPGTSRTLDSTTDLGLAVTANGKVAIAISGGPYRLVLR